jgi:Domain of unknown function (DUF1918)
MRRRTTASGRWARWPSSPPSSATSARPVRDPVHPRLRPPPPCGTRDRGLPEDRHPQDPGPRQLNDPSGPTSQHAQTAAPTRPTGVEGSSPFLPWLRSRPEVPNACCAIAAKTAAWNMQRPRKRRPDRGGYAMYAQAGDVLVVDGDSKRVGLILQVPHADGTPPYVVKWKATGHIAMVSPGQFAQVIRGGDNIIGGACRCPEAPH